MPDRREQFLNTPGVQERLEHIASKHGFTIDELINTIQKESNFKTGALNAAGSGATGLIQFMPATAKDLGTTTSELSTMDAVKQLDYVDKYFTRNHKKGNHPYLTIAYPKSARMGADEIIGKAGSAIARQNPVWQDSNGNVTKRSMLAYADGDAAAKLERTEDEWHPLVKMADAYNVRARKDNTRVARETSAIMNSMDFSQSTITEHDFDNIEYHAEQYSANMGEIGQDSNNPNTRLVAEGYEFASPSIEQIRKDYEGYMASQAPQSVSNAPLPQNNTSTPDMAPDALGAPIEGNSYFLGGAMDKGSPVTGGEAMGAVTGAASMLGGIVSLSKSNQKTSVGGAAASGAMQGASAGMALGPWGAAAGAVIGGVGSLFAAKAANKNAHNLAMDNQIDDFAGQDDMGRGSVSSGDRVVPEPMALGGYLQPNGRQSQYTREEDLQAQGNTSMNPMADGGEVPPPDNVEAGQDFVKNWMDNPNTRETYGSNMESIGKDQLYPGARDFFGPNAGAFEDMVVKNKLDKGVEDVQNTPTRTISYQGDGVRGEYNQIMGTTYYGKPTAGTVTHENTHVLSKRTNVDKDMSQFMADSWGTPIQALQKRYPDMSEREALTKHFKYNNPDASDTTAKLKHANYMAPKDGEMYPRLMEMRQALDVKPGQTVTPGMIKSISGDPKLKQFMDFYEEADLVDMMNKTASTSEEYQNWSKYGGKLNKKQDDGFNPTKGSFLEGSVIYKH